MKKNMFALAALLIASATFVACSSDDNIANENQQPANPTGKYTMTVNASKGMDTRALTLDGETLNATWTNGDQVTVYEGDTYLGTLSATNIDDATCTLTGELTTAPTSSEVTLKFNAPNYTAQNGTLDYIASNCDYATATTTVTVSGNKITGTDVEFTNQQAIVKFTLIDKANNAAISPTALTVTDGTSTVELTSIPAATYTTNGASNVLYVAFPAAGSAKTVTLTATVGDDTYTYEKSNVTFRNGEYYDITVKMTKQAPAPTYTMAADATTADVGKLICTDGHIHANGADAACTKARVAMIAYVGTASDYTHGLAIALEDVSSNTMYNWSDAPGAVTAWASHKTTATTGSWRLPSIKDWQYILIGCGASGSYSDNPSRLSYSGLFSKLETAGGIALKYNTYWSSTERSDNNAKAWRPKFENSGDDSGYATFRGTTKTTTLYVRACLAF